MSAAANYIASVCLPDLDKLSECLLVPGGFTEGHCFIPECLVRGLWFKSSLSDFFFHLILASFVQSYFLWWWGRQTLLEPKKWFCLMGYVSRRERWSYDFLHQFGEGRRELKFSLQGDNRRSCRLVEKQLLKFV